jgi:hypothetical protein
MSQGVMRRLLGKLLPMSGKLGSGLNVDDDVETDRDVRRQDMCNRANGTCLRQRNMLAAYDGVGGPWIVVRPNGPCKGCPSSGR